MEWQPFGRQKENLKEVKPVHDKILIAKLRENQEIHADLILMKGKGKEHAKWQPVCSAYYKLLPTIKITSTIKGAEVNYIY